MIYPKLSDGTIDWCVMCKHEDRDLYDGCCECEYPENSDDPPTLYEPKLMTNADRIRSMTDEKMVKHLACQWKECKNMDVDCDKCLLDWLRQEARS